MSEFDPSGTGSYSAGLFGVPTQIESSKIIIIPVPWEVTTSYGSGTSNGPLSVLKASPQIDLFDLELGESYQEGYHLLPISEELNQKNAHLRPLALKIRNYLEDVGELNPSLKAEQNLINSECKAMVNWVYEQTKTLLADGKIPAVLGGDHSSPEGIIQAVSEHVNGNFGVLHIDAHADLREAYQGFERSHASIMFNVMHAKWRPKCLVQVGIRDFCQEEFSLINARDDIRTFFDLNLKRDLFGGRSWQQCCTEIIESLPKNVYVSFDIDGLSPEYCPHTGTPVPGGLSFDQANYLLGSLVGSGRKIIGFDLNEVAPGDDEWDANVGARLLYKLCGWTMKSQTRDEN